jgi:hypothetical protein
VKNENEEAAIIGNSVNHQCLRRAQRCSAAARWRAHAALHALTLRRA